MLYQLASRGFTHYIKSVMNQKLVLLLLIAVSILQSLAAQNIQLKGTIESIEADNIKVPLPYANV